jgi:hypothetical protein
VTKYQKYDQSEKGKAARRRYAQSEKGNHDHDTGKVRALLCNACNVAEGAIRSTGVDPDVWVARLLVLHLVGR